MKEPETYPDVRVGHVHLRVADLARATAFYRDVLGIEVMAYGPDLGLPGGLSSRRAATTIMLASTPGRATGAHHPRRGTRNFTTLLSSTLTGASSA